MTELTRSQRAADAVTWFCGTWRIIFIATAFITCWLAWSKSWDPYPFILLNLVFTVIEFYQGPLIMMSQNREMERDREAVRALHQKLDAILEKL